MHIDQSIVSAELQSDVRNMMSRMHCNCRNRHNLESKTSRPSNEQLYSSSVWIQTRRMMAVEQVQTLKAHFHERQFNLEEAMPRFVQVLS